jgi:hypothetical protein
MALYSDGTMLGQFDPNHAKTRTSKDIDLCRVTELQVLNHPVSPLAMLARPGWSRPDQVIIEVEIDMKMVPGSIDWDYFILAFVFGFRYGKEKDVIRIDKEGVVNRG